MRVAAPVVAALGGWVLFNAVRTGDAFRFFDAKTAWHEITVLYLLPSLAFGVVGLARYATETFPPYIAGGDLLARRDVTTIRVLFGALVIAQAGCAFFFIADGRLI